MKCCEGRKAAAVASLHHHPTPNHPNHPNHHPPHPPPPPPPPRMMTMIINMYNSEKVPSGLPY